METCLRLKSDPMSLRRELEMRSVLGCNTSIMNASVLLNMQHSGQMGQNIQH